MDNLKIGMMNAISERLAAKREADRVECDRIAGTIAEGAASPAQMQVVRGYCEMWNVIAVQAAADYIAANPQPVPEQPAEQPAQ